MPPFTGKGYCTELGTNMRRFCNMLATERKLVWKRNAALRNLNKIIALWYCQFVLWSSTLLTRDCKVFSTKSPFAPCFTGFIRGVVWCRTEGSAQHKNGPVTCWHSRLLRWYPPGGDWDTTTTFPRVGKASCRQSPRVNRGVKGEKKKKKLERGQLFLGVIYRMSRCQELNPGCHRNRAWLFFPGKPALVVSSQRFCIVVHGALILPDRRWSRKRWNTANCN